MLLLQWVFIANALDKENILQKSSSNSSSIIFSNEEWKKTKYYNKDNNSDIIWNYLSWSYYSTLYGYFDFENVRFVWSTSKCQNSYWYKLAWKA